MDDAQKADLIRRYWEAFDKSIPLENHQRGEWVDNWEYYDGVAEGMGEVFQIIGIDPNSAPSERAIERRERGRLFYEELRDEYGIDLRETPDDGEVGSE